MSIYADMQAVIARPITIPLPIPRHRAVSLIAEHDGFKNVSIHDLTLDQRFCFGELQRFATTVRIKAHGGATFHDVAKADRNYVIASLYALEKHNLLKDCISYFADCLLHHKSKGFLSDKQVASLVRNTPAATFDTYSHACDERTIGFQPYLDIFDKAAELSKPKERNKAQNREAADAKKAANHEAKKTRVAADHPTKINIEWQAAPPEEQAASCADAVFKANEKAPTLFMIGTKPVVVSVDPQSGSASVEPLTPEAMQIRLADVVTLTKKSLTDEPAYIVPPLMLAKFVLTLLRSRLPRLEGVATTPFFDLNGNIVATNGYHQESRTFLALPHALDITLPPPKPTRDQIKVALDTLWKPFSEFPFTNDASKAHVLAMIMQPFVRPMIIDGCPAYVITKPAHGEGAGLLVDLASLMHSGVSASVRHPPTREDDWGKEILSKLVSGSSSMVLDNITKVVKSAALSALLTGDTYEGRVLGKTEDKAIPNRLLVIMTGKNVRFAADIATRVLSITIDSGTPNPTEREFNLKEPRAFVRANRAAMITAVLTIVQGWIAAGRKVPSPAPKLGRFQNYANVMGSILAYAGVPGFLADKAARTDAIDDAEDAIADLVRLMHQTFGETPMPVGRVQCNSITGPDPRSIAQLAFNHQETLPFTWMSDPKERWNQSLGYELSHALGRRFDLDGGKIGKLVKAKTKVGMQYSVVVEPTA